MKNVEEFVEDPDQLVFAVEDMQLQQVGDGDDGNDIRSPGDTITDGYIYVGGQSHKDMEAAAFIVTDKLAGSYITTTVLRRSGHHPEHVDTPTDIDNDGEGQQELNKLQQHPDLHKWMIGDEPPHSTLLHAQQMVIPESKVLHPYRGTVDVEGCTYTVIASNEMKVIMGYMMAKQVDNVLEKDESPLQYDDPKVLSEDIEAALQKLEKSLTNATMKKKMTKVESEENHNDDPNNENDDNHDFEQDDDPNQNWSWVPDAN